MNPQTVMVADDELHLTHILQAKFQQAGFRVIVANDGEEAFELAFERRPDLVISDHQMPVMDGFEFLSKLNELDLKNPPEIIVYSAMHLDEVMRSNLENQCRGVIDKNEIGSQKNLEGMIMELVK